MIIMSILKYDLRFKALLQHMFWNPLVFSFFYVLDISFLNKSTFILITL